MQLQDMTDSRRHGYLTKALLLSVALAVSACSSTSQMASVDIDQVALVATAKKAGATALEAIPTEDGGVRLSGRLDGRQFALVIPRRWNKQAVLFAHGYSQPGTSVAVAANPLEGDGLEVFRGPYAQGFAVGHSAYDKSGMGVRTGVESTHRLKQLVDRLGGRRTYLIGASMGGSITVASIEKYPGEYAGAIAACGVVGSWPEQMGWVIDVRAVYNYFTRATPYELPGEKSIAKSAFPEPSTSAATAIDRKELMAQAGKIAMPVLALFAAAQKNPGGPEDRMIDNIVAASGAVKDPAAIGLPLVMSALGMDDLFAEYGGSIYDNTTKVYSSPHLSTEENAALNRGVERVKADPAAVARAKAWFSPSGHFDAKLISLYNATDPLVPSQINENQLQNAVERAGNSANLVLRSVPAATENLLGSGVIGLRHCGFTKEQVAAAWHDLHVWVETGKKP
jgi:pimeloyl-ACP methyl ester carboxylesterase